MSAKSQDTENLSRFSRLQLGIGTDIVSVLLSATLLCLPIEDGRFWPVTFFAFVPLLLRIWKRSYWSIFIMSWVTIFLYNFYVLQWLDVYGFHWRVILVFMDATSYAFAFVLYFFIIRRFNGHLYATILPTIFVLLDFKQSVGFFGFPWPLLSHSQSSNLGLIQIAAITGCWGVTFLLVHVNEALAHLISGGFKGRILHIAVLPVVLIAASGLYSALVLARDLPDANIRATVVQWEEATNTEWTGDFIERSIQGYRRLTTEELARDIAALNLSEETTDTPRLIVWPETSIPDATRNQYTMDVIRSMARGYNATFVVGCLTWNPGEGEPLDADSPRIGRDYYNSMVVFDDDDTITPIYSKMRLVPFGEVIPLKDQIVDWFPEYPWGDNDIMPGSGYYVADTSVGKIGAVVCYESFFPQVARSIVAKGAEILVLGSNTSWFGRTRASYQHARFDTFRAVENATWFCRAATTGISSVIDPRGRTINETELFVADAFTVPVGLRTQTTFYTAHGDWFPALLGIYLLVILFGVFLVKPAGEDTSA